MPIHRDKILATFSDEEEDERLAVDLLYRAITAPVMQVLGRSESLVLCFCP